MRKFDTKVQHLKYKVLREVSREAWAGKLSETAIDIPKVIVPGKIPTMRCCVYKERAILTERVKIAMGGDRSNKNIIEVIDIACDECPAAGYEVTDSCRGCLAHRCEDVCKRGAISFDHNHVAHIDKTKCVECGMCAKVCPYFAIINRKRPCQIACKVKAITIKEDNSAAVDHNKCISCGACVYQCPFGAITDKSFIVDVIEMIKGSDDNKKYKVYAVVAPSLASQFSYAKTGQIVTGLKRLGFAGVVEAAIGADIVACAEARELMEKGFLTSSCCTAFVDYIEKYFPTLTKYVSHNPSPMAVTAKLIKDKDPDCRVVFIGPCTAKKAEVQRESVRPYVDAVITFEELQALLDSRDIDVTLLEEEKLEGASYFGRVFARSGGVSEAITEGLKGNWMSEKLIKTYTCDGIEECKAALIRKSKNNLDADFIEGMACVGGCIGGAGCLTHAEKNKAEIEKYAKESTKKSISEPPKDII